jgi:hypothetical protein
MLEVVNDRSRHDGQKHGNGQVFHRVIPKTAATGYAARGGAPAPRGRRSRAVGPSRGYVAQYNAGSNEPKALPTTPPARILRRVVPASPSLPNALAPLRARDGDELPTRAACSNGPAVRPPKPAGKPVLPSTKIARSAPPRRGARTPMTARRGIEPLQRAPGVFSASAEYPPTANRRCRRAVSPGARSPRTIRPGRHLRGSSRGSAR